MKISWVRSAVPFLSIPAIGLSVSMEVYREVPYFMNVLEAVTFNLPVCHVVCLLNVRASEGFNGGLLGFETLDRPIIGRVLSLSEI